MSRDRSSWPAIIGSAIAAGVVAFLGFALIDVVFGDEARWGSAATTAGGLVLIWIVIGAATRRGWTPPSQRKKP